MRNRTYFQRGAWFGLGLQREGNRSVDSFFLSLEKDKPLRSFKLLFTEGCKKETYKEQKSHIRL